MATQLSQLPIATAVSGAGLVFDPSIGGWRVSEDLGPVLTQRGDTIGRHKKFLSFTYQRFGFGSIDGIDLKQLQIVNQLSSGTNTYYSQNDMRVDFRVDQFVALGTFGLTDRIDVTLIMPFSIVTLKSQRKSGTLYTVSGAGTTSTTSLSPLYFPGSASGLGDVTANVKANVFRSASEKTSIAVGGQVRFPTGDESNYLGTGAYGFRPYIVISHRGRITPNASLAYQWNGSSSLINNDNLPSSLSYSGGVDVRVVKRLSLSGEFLGQYVINGPRLASSTVTIPGSTLPTASQFIGSYAMDNVSVGFKTNPFGGLFISASAMFKLDDAGLRGKVVPLFGVAYRF
ncbi:MAG: transporter [Terriglobales bacterium]